MLWCRLLQEMPFLVVLPVLGVSVVAMIFSAFVRLEWKDGGGRLLQVVLGSGEVGSKSLLLRKTTYLL